MDYKSRRCAIVTGANKGIGLEICRQMAATGINVVLTARDEKRGLKAFEKLKVLAGDDDAFNIVFHQLDVSDPSSIPPLVDFVKTKFGKLDILVNNAAIAGAEVDWDSLSEYILTPGWTRGKPTEEMSETYEMAEECLQVSYYGAKRTVEAFVPLLQLSESPRIVNVSSNSGILKNIHNEWAKGVLNDVDTLTEERIELVINEFLKDFKEGKLESNGWPTIISAYIMSKLSMNAYTRVLDRKFSNIIVNCVCPSYCKTDLTDHHGWFTAEEGAESVVRVALLPNDGPSGTFFHRAEVIPF